MKKKNGFTLVEIIATIAILLVIIGISIPSVMSIKDKNTEKQYNNVVNTILDSAELYVENKRDNFEYQKDDKTNKMCTAILLQALVNGKYVKAPIKNPRNNTNFDINKVWIRVCKNDDGTLDYAFGEEYGDLDSTTLVITKLVDKKNYYTVSGGKINEEDLKKLVEVKYATPELSQRELTVSPKEISLNTKGEYTVSYTAKDKYFLVQIEEKIKVSVGELELAANPSSWTNQNVTSTIKYSSANKDNNWKYEYSVNGGSTWTTVNNLPTAAANMYTFSSNGTVLARIVDDSKRGQTKTLTVANIDKTKPSISLSPNKVSIKVGQSYNLNTGVTTSDTGGSGIKSGSLTIKRNGTTISSTTGLGVDSHIITYTVSDNAGNITSANRTIEVSDTSLADSLLPPGCTKSGNTYTGTCNYTGANPDNYLWYSGYRWRIIGINPDGSVKIITERPVASVNWGSSLGYEGSYLRTWLNSTFRNSLMNYSTYLVNTTWNLGTSLTTENPSTFSDYVGTITRKEYCMSSASSNPCTGGSWNSGPAQAITTWLNINSLYHTMSYTGKLSGNNYDEPTNYVIGPYISATDNRVFIGSNSNNYLGVASSTFTVDGLTYSFHHSYNPKGPKGVRPVVNLKSNVSLASTSGDGKKDTPYIIGNRASTNALLNSRYIGEHVSFSGKVWRIQAKTGSGTSASTRIILNDYLRTSGTTSTRGTMNGTLNDDGGGNVVEAAIGSESGAKFDVNSSGNIGNYLNTTYFNSLTNNSWIVNSNFGSYSNIKVGLPKEQEIFSGNDVVVSNCGKDTSKGRCFAAYINSYMPYSSGGNTSAGLVTKWYNVGSSSTDSYFRTGTQRAAWYQVNWNPSFIYRPLVNLSSTVKITGGSGTPSDPYKLTKP